MEFQEFEDRKRDHLRHALDPAHQASGLSGLNRIRLAHEALPELDFERVSLGASCLGREAKTPYFIAGMTAGHEKAAELNLRLAEACADRGWVFGVGSQRRQLWEDQSSEWLGAWRALRARAPQLIVIANIGMTQAVQVTVASLRKIVESVEAQALAIHLNPLQECLQKEGTPQFSGSIQKLEQICASLGVPVILKETGCGFTASTLRRVASIGLAAVDVSGLGGTHWGRVEGARAEEGAQDAIRAETARTFAEWGVSTVDSVLAAVEALPADTQIWASGGIRSGLDAAKLIALGAHRVGFAKPALEAALQGEEELRKWMELREFELKTALFCTGSASPAGLRRREDAWKKNDI